MQRPLSPVPSYFRRTPLQEWELFILTFIMMCLNLVLTLLFFIDEIKMFILKHEYFIHLHIFINIPVLISEYHTFICP